MSRSSQRDERSDARSSDLRDRLRMTRSFASAEERSYLEIQRAASLLLQGFTHCLREHSAPELDPRSALTPSQYNLLRILRGAHPDGLTCGEIADRLVTPGPDVTRLLDRLEERGCVERSRDPNDRRVVRASLSTEGLETLAALDRPVEDWLRGMLGHLLAHEHERLWELLESSRTMAEEA